MSNRNDVYPKKSIRWWPLVGILLVFIGVMIQTWGFSDIYRQGKYMRTGKFFFIGLGVFILWLLFYSRVRKKIALSILGMMVLIGVVLATSLKITGVDGDLLPIVRFRWQQKEEVTQNQAHRPDIQVTSTTLPPADAVPGLNFPQFMGPDRTAVLKGPELSTNWNESSPVELWRKPVGAGWSGFSIVPPFAVTQEQHGDEERTVAYEMGSGAIIWSHGDQSRYATVIAGEGPRSTPTIHGDKVFTYGANGILNCLQLTNGKPVWSRNVWAEQGGKVPDWGVSCSPLIAGDKVIVTSSLNQSNLAAFHISDGRKVWDAPSRGADYSSPGLFKLHNVEQVFHFNGKGVSSFEPQSGKLLWHYDWPGGHPHIAMPLVVDTNLVVISSGYGTGAELVQVSKTNDDWQAERVWKSMGLKSKFAPVVVFGGHIYGLDDGIFTCLELSTGKRLWKDGRYGHGQFLLVNDVILMMAENGRVVLIKPDTAGLVELASHKVFAEKTWNPPALAGDLLLIRNDREAVGVRLPLRKK